MVKRYQVQIENYAENGRSTKQFIDEWRLATIYDRIHAGDFLFVQFGHNDEKASDPARYTDPETDFPANLERFVNVARNKGATPVFITPLTRYDRQRPRRAVPPRPLGGKYAPHGGEAACGVD